MSSTKNTLPNLDLLAGPIQTRQKSAQEKNKPGEGAAVIRPVPTGSGLAGMIRIDPPKTPQKSTGRTVQLEDYVRWLRQQNAEGKSTAEETREAELEMASPTGPPNTSIAAPTHADSTPAAPTARVDRTVQVNQTAQVANEAAPAIDSPLKQLTEIPEAELTGQINEALAGAEAVARERQMSNSDGFSNEAILRVDAPKETEAAEAPKSHLHRTPETESGSTTFAPAKPVLSDSEASEFISTISKAIASVISNRDETEIESEVRRHVESNLSSVDQAAVAPVKPTTLEQTTTVEVAPDTTNSQSEMVAKEIFDPEPIFQDDLLDMATTTEAPAAGNEDLAELMKPVGPAILDTRSVKDISVDILKDSRKEVPTTIAAWDVEEFRWPLVSNQMIVAGSEAMSQLYDSVSRVITPHQQRIAITSLERNAGTTSISISLGRWAAACGNTVLLIDADISNPQLSRQVGLAPNVSWLNACNKSLPVAEVIIRSQKSNLCIMPMSPIVMRAAWPRFICDNLADLVERVKDHFDLIIMDVGPATQLMDELSRPESLVDAAMLVHTEGETPKFRKTRNLMQTFGLEKILVTQNRIKQANSNVA